MAKSELRTKIAVLRSAIGISANDFAQLIGRSFHTQKALESGRLALSESLAVEISKKTGALLVWLLDAEMTGPPQDQSGKIMTREGFERHVASVMAGTKLHTYKGDSATHLAGKLAGILKKAEKLPNFDLAFYRTVCFLDDLKSEFLDPYEKKPKASGSKKPPA